MDVKLESKKQEWEIMRTSLLSVITKIRKPAERGLESLGASDSTLSSAFLRGAGSAMIALLFWR